jgi:hypothetical protein
VCLLPPVLKRLQDDMQKLLKPFSRSAYTGKSSNSSSAAELAAENALDKRCRDSYAAVKQFENTHNLSVQSMGVGYTAARAGLVAMLLEAGTKMKIRNDVAHDAVLLMDRAMSASMKVSTAEASACDAIYDSCSCMLAVFTVALLEPEFASPLLHAVLLLAVVCRPGRQQSTSDTKLLPWLLFFGGDTGQGGCLCQHGSSLPAHGREQRNAADAGALA